ncbi:MAG: hypothetical protein CM15mL1_1110 [Libanvirus sp.]|nr:MAG: hypothetical protein CM15mL1_1110 [Libanvirus sp.]
MIKSTIAALAATPLLFSGAAFAGPYVNVEASGSYPDGAYGLVHRIPTWIRRNNSERN